MASNTNSPAKFTVGRLALAAGVGITTVRYYQKRGLLRLPEKPGTGSFRAYGERDLERLRLIRRAQELGFTLAEIAQLADYVESRNCHELKSMADNKLKAIQNQARELDGIHKTLASLVAACPTDCPDDCPLINRFTQYDGH